MPYVLYATGAALILSIIGNMLLAVKLATAREVADDLREDVAERKHERAKTLAVLGRVKLERAELAAENATLRAEKARRMAPLIAAARKAKAASKAN